MGITTDKKEGSVERGGEAIGHASPWNEPERKASVPATPATPRPTTIAKDGTAVTGALKHHLKKQNK